MDLPGIELTAGGEFRSDARRSTDCATGLTHLRRVKKQAMYYVPNVVCCIQCRLLCCLLNVFCWILSTPNGLLLKGLFATWSACWQEVPCSWAGHFKQVTFFLQICHICSTANLTFTALTEFMLSLTMESSLQWISLKSSTGENDNIFTKADAHCVL